MWLPQPLFEVYLDEEYNGFNPENLQESEKNTSMKCFKAGIERYLKEADASPLYRACNLHEAMRYSKLLQIKRKEAKCSVENKSTKKKVCKNCVSLMWYFAAAE